MLARYQDRRGVTHARWPRTPWMICGLILHPTDVPLPDDAEIDCEDCLRKIGTPEERKPVDTLG